MASKLIPLWTLIMSLPPTIPTAFPFSNFISVTLRLVWLICCVSYPLICIRKSEHKSLMYANLGSAKMIKFHAYFGASYGVVQIHIIPPGLWKWKCLYSRTTSSWRVRQEIADWINAQQTYNKRPALTIRLFMQQFESSSPANPILYLKTKSVPIRLSPQTSWKRW